MTTLHLGCGAVHLPGAINIDRRYQPGVDRIDNIGILQWGFPDGSVDDIYSAHALDHFDRWTYKTVLKRWHTLLRPGGTLHLATPDFEWAHRTYSRTGDVTALIGHLYAGQDYDGNVRHFIMTFASAVRDLREVGFVSVERYDPRSYLDSFVGIDSSTKLEDASTIVDAEGKLRSLCVVARKAE